MWKKQIISTSSIPVPWRKLFVFRCKKLMTLKHTIISNKFVSICNKIIFVLSGCFLSPCNHNPIQSINLFKITYLIYSRPPPPLSTCLVCLHYWNIISVFSKIMYSLVFAFRTSPSCSQILHFAEGTMLVLQGTFYKVLHTTDRIKNTKSSLLKKLWD